MVNSFKCQPVRHITGQYERWRGDREVSEEPSTLSTIIQNSIFLIEARGGLAGSSLRYAFGAP